MMVALRMNMGASREMGISIGGRSVAAEVVVVVEVQLESTSRDPRSRSSELKFARTSPGPASHEEGLHLPIHSHYKHGL